jgi:hypothetical protein
LIYYDLKEEEFNVWKEVGRGGTVECGGWMEREWRADIEGY